MRSWIARTALISSLLVPTVTHGQLFRGMRNRIAPSGTEAGPGPGASPRDPAVKPAQGGQVVPPDTALPEPTKPDELPPATIVLPAEPIEPYLLTRQAGPFMVLAHTFRGPNAAKYAQALAIELRRDYNLPAYVFYEKIQPLHSLIRNVPPQADRAVQEGLVDSPARYRIYDEAAVLVGNNKTERDNYKLLHYVKKLQPKCLNDMPNLMNWRRGMGLKRAMVTTNPYIPAQDLFPKADPMITQMNSGPRSLFRNPAPYTLQVAEFTGRSFIGDREPPRHFLDFKGSPLTVAHKQAEELAELLAKSEVIRKAGVQVYTYHDRFSSKVTVGSFRSKADPAAEPVRQVLQQMASSLATAVSNPQSQQQAAASSDPFQKAVAQMAMYMKKENVSNLPFGPQPTLFLVPNRKAPDAEQITLPFRDPGVVQTMGNR